MCIRDRVWIVYCHHWRLDKKSLQLYSWKQAIHYWWIWPVISSSIMNCHDSVTEKLHYKKICAWWVPKMLTEEHKKKHMVHSLTFLEWYYKDGNEFLNNTVTRDQTWICHIHQRPNDNPLSGIIPDHRRNHKNPSIQALYQPKKLFLQSPGIGKA